MNNLYGSDRQPSGKNSNYDRKSQKSGKTQNAPHAHSSKPQDSRTGRGRAQTAKQSVIKAGRFRHAITAVIVNISISAIMLVLAYIIISSPESREIYTKFLFVPVSAFAGGFISFIMNKDLPVNALCSALIYLLIHMIFIEFSAWALLWMLFYMLNAFLGFLSGLIVRTFH